MKKTKKYLQGGIKDAMGFPFALTTEEINKLYNGEWVCICRQINSPKPRENK